MTSHLRQYWICQISGWGLYAILNLALLRATMPFGWKENLATLLYGVWGIFITHLLREVVRRNGWVMLAWKQLLPRAMVAVPVTAMGLTLLFVFSWLFIFRDSPWAKYATFNTVMASTFFNMNFLAALWLAIYLAVQFVRRSLAVRDAQLAALQAQVNPHFLFNSLNSLRGLIAENPAAAQDAVTRLAQLLRYSLAQARRTTVTLDEELEAVADYLAVEKLRFEERLQVEIRLSPEVEKQRQNLLVPPMSLQTLVENALKHGIAKLPGGGEVEITAQHANSMLTLTVSNPGNFAGEGNSGTGLQNLRERIRLLRGDAAKLTLQQVGGKVVAQLALPTTAI